MSQITDERLKDCFTLLGLDDICRKLYLQLIEKGAQKARYLSLEFEIPKTTVLEKLYILEESGLVIKNKVKNSYEFAPEHPSVITSLLNRREKQIEHAKNKSLTEIKELEKKYEPRILPTITFYEGRDELQKLYLKKLKAGGDIYTLSDIEKESKYFGNFIHDYWKLRSNARIQTFVLMPNTNGNRDISIRTDQKYLRKSFFYPDTKSVPIHIDIFNNTVSFLSLKDEFAFSIEDETLAQSMKALMELIPVIE